MPATFVRPLAQYLEDFATDVRQVRRKGPSPAVSRAAPNRRYHTLPFLLYQLLPPG